MYMWVYLQTLPSFPFVYLIFLVPLIPCYGLKRNLSITQSKFIFRSSCVLLLKVQGSTCPSPPHCFWDGRSPRSQYSKEKGQSRQQELSSQHCPRGGMAPPAGVPACNRIPATLTHQLAGNGSREMWPQHKEVDPGCRPWQWQKCQRQDLTPATRP